MIVAGVVLLGLGTVTLWRTRRRDGPRTRRYARRVLIAIAAAVAFVFVLFPLTSSYVYTHAARAVVPPARLGAPHEDVTLTTSDGLRLRGWYIPSRNGAAVIAFPGRSGPQRPARMLARHGYGVLLFDRRGEGESDGDPNALGWAGDRDLDAAIAFLRNRRDVEANRIGGIGLSVGGEMLLDRAADSRDLRAVVSDGAGIRSTHEARLSSGVNRWFGVPFWTMTTAGVALFANDLPPPSLKELVAKISPRAIFLIYAGHGQGGENLNPQYFEAAGEPKTLWKIPEASHTDGIAARPAEYERRMIAFFDQALNVDD
jgi:dienelactone hydrolase